MPTLFTDHIYNAAGSEEPSMLFFKKINTPTYGNCYVFNSNLSRNSAASDDLVHSSLTGANYGLTLVMHLEPQHYMQSTVAQTLGARVTIHGNDVFPLVDEAGMDIGPASTRITRQEYPYQSNCFRTWSQVGVEPAYVDATTGATSLTGERFTLSECHRHCLQLRIVRACGCYHVLYPMQYAVHGRLQAVGQPCLLTYNSQDSNCTEAVIADIAGGNASRDCVCSVPCADMDYQPQLSVASWPQGDFLVLLLKGNHFVPDDEDVGVGDQEQWAKQFAKLNVYYRDISSASITESPVYTCVDATVYRRLFETSIPEAVQRESRPRRVTRSWGAWQGSSVGLTWSAVW
ncbi:degenerin-like protein unc-105 [Pollicipes pollicipes]|uniref:degenerin-like protein unc-105 n=1 Tax=Pollicipes pollicipes TaxID=41117 RepID=UPI001884DBFB|nr:degenerin-like protein unc-105 [Pollicipes pollicipes]